MTDIAKMLIYLGMGAILLGLFLWGVGKVGFPIGKLPGDIYYKGENTSFSFPIVTCILVSVILTVVLNLVFWLMRR